MVSMRETSRICIAMNATTSFSMFLLRVCIVLTAESGKLHESNGVWCWLYQEPVCRPSAVTRPAEKRLEPDGVCF